VVFFWEIQCLGSGQFPALRRREMGVMEYMKNRTWLEVDLDAIGRNYRTVKERIGPDCQVIAVVKANAYGLGAVAVARELESFGCAMFGVVCMEEAMALRDSGIKAPVLVMGPINPQHTELAVDESIEVALTSLGHARALSKAVKAAGKSIKGHIKIDTGLRRLGIPVEGRSDEVVAEILKMTALNGIDAVGLFTHFTASSGMPGSDEFNEKQMSLFAEIANRLDAAKIHLKKHCSSTLATVRYPDYRYDYVRVGSLLYGLRPDTYGGLDIDVTVEMKTRIYQIREVKAGSPVSYGPMFHTLRDSRLAVVPVGFADGLRRTIANRGSMLVHGKKAPIVGQLSSDYTTLDVTDIPEAKEGDIVTVFGCDHGVAQPVYEFGDLYPGTPAEVTAVISPRIPRYYLKGGLFQQKANLN